MKKKFGWVFENQKAIRARFAMLVNVFGFGVLLGAERSWVMLGVFALPILFLVWGVLDVTYLDGQLDEMKKNIAERQGVLESLEKMSEVLESIHLPPADRYH